MCLSRRTALFLMLTIAALAQDDGNRLSVSNIFAFKSSTVYAYAHDDPVLYPERSSLTELLRMRWIMELKYEDWLSSEFAYEHRMRSVTPDAGVGNQTLPRNADAPYRITQLDRNIGEETDRFSYRHELDRALAAMHLSWADVTIGRQAIGLGRGVMFGAVDLFAPFSPLEADREWRRGVDAIRVERQLSDTTSAELIAAFGESWEESAIIARVRGYVGDVDGEVLFGKRAEDKMLGFSFSGAVNDAEVHLELAAFKTPEDHPDDGLFGKDNLIGKAVFGSSYTFDIGQGLTVLGEYHYSGFGVEDIEDANARFLDPDFQTRFLRGDTQIIGQHVAAVQLSYPATNEWSTGLLILQSLQDGSGVAAPTLTYDCTDQLSFVLSAYGAWGDETENGQIQSEYGGTPFSLFLQINLTF